MIVLLSASLVIAEEKTGGFLSDLADKLKAADQELSKVNTILKQKGQEFEQLINKEVEEGFVKLQFQKSHRASSRSTGGMILLKG